MVSCRAVGRAFAAAAIACCVSAPVRAQDVFGTIEEFRAPLSRVAEAVSKLLKSRGDDAITVGQFTGPPAFGAAAGPGLQKMLSEEFERAGVRVRKLGGALGVSGEYRYVGPEGSTDFKQIRLEVKLTDRSGQVLTDLTDEVPVGPIGPMPPEGGGGDSREKVKVERGMIAFDTLSTPASAAALLGLTRDFDLDHKRPIADDGTQGPFVDPIEESLDRSTATVAGGTRLRASATSPFGLEVIVGGRPRAIEVEDGQPFVTLAKGESFRLKLTNGASFEAAAMFTLDGVNSFGFSEVRSRGKPKYTRWIIPPGQPAEVAGWHIDNTKVREFKVTDFSDSAAALAGSESNLGAITVVVGATWPEGQERPADEGFEVRSQAPGVGLGDEAEQRVEEDRVKREYGRVRAVLTVRYVKPEAGPAE